MWILGGEECQPTDLWAWELTEPASWLPALPEFPMAAIISRLLSGLGRAPSSVASWKYLQDRCIFWLPVADLLQLQPLTHCSCGEQGARAPLSNSQSGLCSTVTFSVTPSLMTPLKMPSFPHTIHMPPPPHHFASLHSTYYHLLWVELCPPKKIMLKSWPLVPQGMTFDPQSNMTDVFVRKKFKDREMQENMWHEHCHMTMKTGTAATQVQAMGPWRAPTNQQKLGRGKIGLPDKLQRDMALPTPWFWTSAVLSHPVSVTFYSSLRESIHHLIHSIFKLCV